MAESKNNEIKGGGGPGRRMAGRPRPKVDNPGLLFKRIMRYVFKYYGIHMIVVLRYCRSFHTAGCHGACQPGHAEASQGRSV